MSVRLWTAFAASCLASTLASAATPVAPAPVSPQGGGITSPTTYTWRSVADAVDYYLWVSDDAGTVVERTWYAGATVCSGATCTVTPTTPLTPRPYTWWIQARNTSGTSPWSIGVGFTVVPMGSATLVSPSGNITATQPTYTWNAVANADSYYLWVERGPGTIVHQVWYAASTACAGTTCSVTPALTLGMGQHTWWIQARGTSGIFGSWSAGTTFTVAPPPTAPTPTPPASATLVSPSGTAGTQPTYTWNAVAGADSYYLWVDRGVGTTVHQVWYTAATVCTGTTCSVTPALTLSMAQHTWWIQARNPSGTGPWSAGLTFTVTPRPTPTPPGAATLVSPSGTSATQPAYTWNAVAGADSYYLWVERGAGTIVHQVWYTAATVCVGTTCSVTPALTLQMAPHRWWIQTRGPSGTGPWSAAMSFTVSSRPTPRPTVGPTGTPTPPPTATPTPLGTPGVPTLLSPSGSVSTARPLYTWRPVATATDYFLWVNGPSGGAIIQSWLPASAYCTATECSVMPATNLTDGAHQWWIQARNTRGEGPWSAAMALQVSISLPPAPTLISPSGAGVSNRPTYRWNAAANATDYLLWVNGPSGGALIQTWYSAATACFAGTCSATPATTLVVGSHTWWVQGRNSRGDGPWSAGLPFTVTAATPTSAPTATPTATPTGAPTATPTPGSTLYVTTLLPENGAVTSATGTSSVLLAADELSALVTLDFNGLTTPQTAAHIHGPADPGQTAQPVFSVPMGTFRDVLWVFQPTGNLTIQDQVGALKAGRLYINVHSERYPPGEIRGHYRLAATATPRPTPPPTATPTPGPPSLNESVRFLQQASWGATTATADRVSTLGYDAWIEEQFAVPISTYSPYVQAAPTTNDDQRTRAFQARFWQNAFTGEDQLRQRVGWALSQILVVSGLTIDDGPGMAFYVDMLNRNAFGNYRQLLYELTLNPAMGDYLDMVNNDRPNPAVGRVANENYAREVLQLFSVGVFRLNPDGTLVIGTDGRPVSTYDQGVIEGLARVFTGWTYAPRPGASNVWRNPRYLLAPMVLHQDRHDVGTKTILDGVVLPGGRNGDVDLNHALDVIMAHPNVGPYIGRQLIQHLVTSDPSPAYVERVAGVFNDNGSGVKGDLRAVVKAILLDPDARGHGHEMHFGRLKEPAQAMLQLLRPLSARGDGLGLSGIARGMGQDPYWAPTVFNYYQPDFQLPGTMLSAPPFQIYTEATAVNRANWVNTVIFSTVGVPFGPAGTSVAIDMAPLDALAGNPTALVDVLDQALMHGSMSAGMRSTIVDAVGRIAATRTRARVQNAIYLVATSAQFNVCR